MTSGVTSAFLALVSQDRALTLRFIEATKDKHSDEAINAIARFAREVGFDLSFEDIRSIADAPHLHR
ncbi:hypothetical protein [Pelagibacterium halotolerans]|uniref:Nif11 domain-containing protein n=1 Tax=Pelagibacterium halotolerans (strain DSM 22347 / JCM 15775 / CGMCC 1.7692 / B2) TaxID=1082931 RepID=G4RCS0_PELHB|nr:hypothetical protein [Pelagibacterium halotolerans]AEQ51725.1 hypothetical protein KKY_1710 [Pelagibacterium halotolerans B2]QJR18455.1 hypothetical protein HKM20_08440 [Pelagibacterium halotolerans]SEA21501.1 hypothetical protein SAMN05428936_102346 [Pelagibacterium halotolerans]